MLASVAVSEVGNDERVEAEDEVDVFNPEVSILGVVHVAGLLLGRGSPSGGVLVVPVSSVDVHSPRVSHSVESVGHLASGIFDFDSSDERVGVAWDQSVWVGASSVAAHHVVVCICSFEHGPCLGGGGGLSSSKVSLNESNV